MTSCGSADSPVTISRIVGFRFGFRWYFVAPHAPLKSDLFERHLRAAPNVTDRRHIPRLTPRQPQPSLRSGRRTLNDISNNRQAGRWDVPRDDCSHRFQCRSRAAPDTAGLRTVVHQNASPARTPPLIAAFRTSAPARTQKRNPWVASHAVTRCHRRPDRARGRRGAPWHSPPRRGRRRTESGVHRLHRPDHDHRPLKRPTSSPGSVTRTAAAMPDSPAVPASPRPALPAGNGRPIRLPARESRRDRPGGGSALR